MPDKRIGRWKTIVIGTNTFFEKEEEGTWQNILVRCAVCAGGKG